MAKGELFAEIMDRPNMCKQNNHLYLTDVSCADGKRQEVVLRRTVSLRVGLGLWNGFPQAAHARHKTSMLRILNLKLTSHVITGYIC